MCSYVSGLGQPPFDPRMMVSLLLHGYASGLYSSRRIARACCERNAVARATFHPIRFFIWESEPFLQGEITRAIAIALRVAPGASLGDQSVTDFPLASISLHGCLQHRIGRGTSSRNQSVADFHWQASAFLTASNTAFVLRLFFFFIASYRHCLRNGLRPLCLLPAPRLH